jgi:nucleoside 2-deoxyribosyltransferase
VFVWIDENFATAYGTMTEIGYAAALGKPIFAARSPAAREHNMVEMWFPLSLEKFFGTHETPASALRSTLREYRALSSR